MRTLKIALALTTTLGILSLALASPALALELPDVHLLSGVSYPATGEGSLTGAEAVVLETELGEKLVAEEVKANLTASELSALGLLTLTFTNVREPKSATKCHTSGSAEGTVVLPGEYHFVYTSTTPLTIAMLLLFKELIAECNSSKLKVKVRAPTLLKLEKVVLGTELHEFGIQSKCSGKGKQELKEYLNDEAKLTKGTLTANFGLGFESACLKTEKELVVKMNKMIGFTSAEEELTSNLPFLAALSGETYSIVATGAVQGSKLVEIEAVFPEKLVADEVTAQLTVSELASYGSIELHLANTVEPGTGTKCNTTGRPEGSVWITGEYHVVYGTASPLAAELLVLFSELTVTCNVEKLKVKIRGPVLLKLNRESAATDVTEFRIAARCTKGKQELKEYLGDEGETIKGVMSVNFGFGFETACLRIGKELVMKPGKMLEFPVATEEG
ncbi:MAG TPA: hypothetical protein VMB05_06720, partial [Solirubrobacteraceae bacterium]|nr:hypothetical protein [Solirubrobacteraceae bacterium]